MIHGAQHCDHHEHVEDRKKQARPKPHHGSKSGLVAWWYAWSSKDVCIDMCAGM